MPKCPVCPGTSFTLIAEYDEEGSIAFFYVVCKICDVVVGVLPSETMESTLHKLESTLDQLKHRLDEVHRNVHSIKQGL